MTSAAASHAVVVAKDGSGFLDSYSSVNALPKVQLNDRNGKVLTVLEANELDAEIDPLTPYIGMA